MKGVSQIIFNELASRRPIILPGLGTLYTETEPAAVEHGRVSAPATRVLFSRSLKPKGSRTVVSLIAASGMEQTEAQRLYDRWLESVTTDEGGAMIEDVGELKDDIFTPFRELDDVLNPPSAAPRRMRKRMCAGAKTAIVIGIIILLLVIAAIWYFNSDCRARCMERRQATITAVEITAPQPAVEIEPVAPVVQAGRWHIVGGVFSVAENADRFIAEYEAQYRGEKAIKLPYKSGKTLVSIYAAGSEEEARARMRKLSRERYIDYWVYEEQR